MNKLTVKITDEGKGCTKCKKFLPFEMFYKARTKTPFTSKCKDCIKKGCLDRNMEVYGAKTAPKCTRKG